MSASVLAFAPSRGMNSADIESICRLSDEDDAALKAAAEASGAFLDALYEAVVRALVWGLDSDAKRHGAYLEGAVPTSGTWEGVAVIKFSLGRTVWNVSSYQDFNTIRKAATRLGLSPKTAERDVVGRANAMLRAAQDAFDAQMQQDAALAVVEKPKKRRRRKKA